MLLVLRFCSQVRRSFSPRSDWTFLCECEFTCLFHRHLQSPFSEDIGSPLEYSYGGTHGTQYALWIFPDPTRHIESTLEASAFAKVCRRFNLVRESLQRELLLRVQTIVPELREVDYDSDSSGLSDDDDGPQVTPPAGEDPYRTFLANTEDGNTPEF
jgi:hypothetical protein